MTSLLQSTSDRLDAGDVGSLRGLFETVWSHDWTSDDWEHAFGGRHFILKEDAEVLAHASVVERELHTGGFELRTGYVEAVATSPAHQGRGQGSTAMRAVGDYIDEQFEFGALNTGHTGFYTRLGWSRWTGPTWVRTKDGLVRTADEDGNVLVRRTHTSPVLNLAGDISREWRNGDVW